MNSRGCIVRRAAALAVIGWLILIVARLCGFGTCSYFVLLAPAWAAVSGLILFVVGCALGVLMLRFWMWILGVDVHGGGRRKP